MSHDDIPRSVENAGNQKHYFIGLSRARKYWIFFFRVQRVCGYVFAIQIVVTKVDKIYLGNLRTYV